MEQFIRFQRDGAEVKPSRVWSEQYEAARDAGHHLRSCIAYRYAGKHVGRRDHFGSKPKKKELFVRFLQENPDVHRLTRWRQARDK